MDANNGPIINLTWKGKNINLLKVILSILFFSVALALYAYKKWNDTYLWQRAVLFFGTGIFFYLVRPASKLHKVKMKQLEKPHKMICLFVMCVTCLTAFFTMRLSDWWTDKGPDYQFQYEAMTEAVLDGHLYLDLKVSPELAAMENPYDSVKRSEDQVSYYWDHAFYNGHYYMYFGVAPVFVLFIPFKLLGITLYSYQATQIFVVFIIMGMFAVFREITKRMYPKIPLSGYLAVSVAASWITVWYAVKYPALYCTANSSGVCMAVWGFYFCYRAFVIDTQQKRSMLHGVVGALLSALTFGCRPTIGLSCIVLIPLLIFYLRRCESIKDFGKTFLAFCVPFAVVAALLMLYNYARFENPFEFGQSYQLTIVDQHAYQSNHFKLDRCLSGLLYHFFGYEDVSNVFPYIHQDGNFVLFPILLIGFRSLLLTGERKKGSLMVKGLAPMMILSVELISSYHVTWAPVVFRRYAMDFNFLLGFLLMFGVCSLYWNAKDPARVSFFLTLLAVYTVVICFLLLFVDYDYSIATHQPEMLEKARNLVVFWKK